MLYGAGARMHSGSNELLWGGSLPNLAGVVRFNEVDLLAFREFPATKRANKKGSAARRSLSQ